MQRSFVFMLSFVALGLLLIAGCGDDGVPTNYKTTVEVLYKGQPVEGAVVTLQPDGHESPNANGVTGADGKVDLFTYKGKGKGVIPGNYLVAVQKIKTEEVENISTDDPRYGQSNDNALTAGAGPEYLVPQQYMTPATSGLTCTVTEDTSTNEFTFELED